MCRARIRVASTDTGIRGKRYGNGEKRENEKVQSGICARVHGGAALCTKFPEWKAALRRQKGEIMKKGLTEIVFILDRSGSMSGLEADTVGGFGSMLKEQKQKEGEALVSTVLFNQESQVIHDRVDIRRVEPMTEREYRVGGTTALLDAVGGAVHHIGNIHKYARQEDVPEHTLFVITTDGMENASRYYTADRVREMIERQKSRYGWEFLFLGANIDAVKTAGSFGIDQDHAVNYHCDREGTRLNFQVLGQAVSSVRCAAPLGSAWKESIEKDYKKRKRGLFERR